MATRPTQVSENILANCNTVVCHSLTSGKDVDLALNYMVNRLEADRFMSDLRLLDVGECLVQLNDGSTQVPAKCRVGLDGHRFLFEKRPLVRPEPQERPILGEQKPPLHDPPPPEDDSAWDVYDRLPEWARRVASIVAGQGGSVRINALIEMGYSKRHLKQMARGPYQTLTAFGTMVSLTNLGRKVVAVGEARDASGRDAGQSDC